MAQQTGRTFEDMQQRLEQIVNEVAAEDISLDDALALYMDGKPVKKMIIVPKKIINIVI